MTYFSGRRSGKDYIRNHCIIMRYIYYLPADRYKISDATIG